MANTDFMPGEDVVAGLRKDIEQYEAERARVHKQVMWRVPVFVGVVVILAILLAYAFNSFASPYEQWTSSPHMFLYFGSLVALFGAWSWAMSPARALRQSFRDRLLPIVFGFVKDMRYRNGGTPDSFDRLPKQAVGSFNRQAFDDCVSGTYEGFPFELYETTLSYKAGKSDSTIFRGVVTSFQAEKPFPGLLIAMKRAGMVSKFFRDMFGSGGLEQIQSGNATLDEAYEFRTDNPGAAGPLVSGRLAKVLEWLGQTWPGEPPRVALWGPDGFLLLPITKNFFELPGISTPIDYKVHVEPIVADMVSLLATASLVRKISSDEDEPLADVGKKGQL